MAAEFLLNLLLTAFNRCEYLHIVVLACLIGFNWSVVVRVAIFIVIVVVSDGVVRFVNSLHPDPSISLIS